MRCGCSLLLFAILVYFFYISWRHIYIPITILIVVLIVIVIIIFRHKIWDKIEDYRAKRFKNVKELKYTEDKPKSIKEIKYPTSEEKRETSE